MNRRDLIKAFAALAPITVAGRVWAAPASDARLLVVFLRGAYDAANVLVPVSSDFYYSSRPTLAVARPDDGTRSHFETQDTIELGQSVGGSRDYRSGLMSRLAAELTRVKPIAFTEQLPLVFRG